MDLTIDIEKKDFEKLLKDAAKCWDDKEFREVDEKGKGYSFEFDNCQTDNAEIDDNELHVYGDWKKEHSFYYSLTFDYDSLILSKTIEYVVKSLNRFKSAMESLSAI